MTKDRFLRMLVPSVPVLARTPLAAMLDAMDRVIKRRHPEWRDLPPASLRMRIGVGNTILRNHAYFVASGNAIVEELAGRGVLTRESAVLELGCGCGRNAVALKRFLSEQGSYHGQDVDGEMIAWCKANLADARTRFDHADVYSKVYNPRGVSSADYRFPVGDGSLSLIFAVSVFSHLLYEDAEHYVRECARSLAPGGHLHMTLFILDYLKGRLGDRWTFSHQLDRCFVDSLRYPEAAVAFELETMRSLLSAHGLAIVDTYNTDKPQQTLIARKAG